MPEKIRALLYDLVSEARNETKIFLSVLQHQEIVRMIQEKDKVSIEVVISRICEYVGMSNEWAKNTAVLLFEYFDKEYTFETELFTTSSEKELKVNNEYELGVFMDVFHTHTNKDIDSFLKRINIFLQDGDFSNAYKYCEKVLDIDPYCSIAYFDELMAEKKATNLQQLIKCGKISNNNLFIKAQKFGDKIINERFSLIAEASDKAFDSYCKRVRSISLLQNTIVSSSPYHIAGVCLDGSVWAAGGVSNSKFNELKVSNWKNIVAVSAGSGFTVGVKADGHVILTEGAGFTDYKVRPCTNYFFDLSSWNNIVAVSSKSHIVGLRSDGTVVAQGLNRYGECNVSNWTDIIAIATDYERTIGLKADGTVVATGNNENGECNVFEWSDIIAIAPSMDCVLGLKSDGTVVCTKGSDNHYGQCDVSEWSNIIALASNSWTSFGIKSDGTVVSTHHDFFGESNVHNWKEVVALVPIGQQQVFTTICIKKDGTMQAVGSTFKGLSDVLQKRIFTSFDTWESEYAQNKVAKQVNAENEYRIFQQKVKEEQIRSSNREKNLCQYCGGNFKGIFIKKCINCGKEKDY